MQDWFDKKDYEGKVAYCQKHPNSKRCQLFFKNQRSVSEKEEDPTKESSHEAFTEDVSSKLKKNLDKEVPKESQKGDHYYDTESDYEWARKNKFSNLGEEVGGLARHNSNKHRDWSNFDSMDFTVKDMIKIVTPETKDIPEGFEPAFWVIREIMKTYPKTNGVNKTLWRDLFKEFYSKGIDIALEEKTPSLVALNFTKYLNEQFQKLALLGPEAQEERTFCRMASHFAFSDKNGPLQKLLGAFYPEGKRANLDKLPEVFMRLEDKLEEVSDVSSKFRKILDGEGFNSTITGVKENSGAFNEGAIREFLPIFRNGESHFKDYEESANFLLKDCLFRSIQFGNGATTEERETFIRNLAEASRDMAQTLGLEPRDLSFNGKIILCLGAIRTGNNLASYSPQKDIINFKRKNGWGTYAHEWGHALSFIVAEDILNNKNKLNVKKGKYGSFEVNSSYFSKVSKSKEVGELQDLFRKIRTRMRSHEDWKSCDYKFAKWLVEGEEIFARCFETYIYEETKKRGVDNKYLANIPNHFGWPNEEEMEIFRPLIKSFLKIYKPDSNQ